MTRLETERLSKGDCLKVMEDIETDSIDMVLADPPYGMTQCRWDSIIPLEPLWTQLIRITKSNSAIVMTASQPFTTTLINSNIKMFKYCWIYQKTTPTGHLNAKIMPLRAHEDIVVFYRSPPTYNPQKTTGHKRKTSSARHEKTDIYGEHGFSEYDSTDRYPLSVQRFSTDKQKSRLHPNQKPVALFEYLIKTYTDEDDLVLDFCAGSGTTGIACQNLKRRFILIERDKYILMLFEND